jgi:hypothetical protein
VLWEVANIVEQIFRIACIENLRPRPEDYDTAADDYRAECGLSDTAMHEALRSSLTAMREIRERAQVIALMRLYAKRWRPWDPEGERVKLPSRQKRKPRKAGKFGNRAGSCPAVAPESDFLDQIAT